MVDGEEEEGVYSLLSIVACAILNTHLLCVEKCRSVPKLKGVALCKQRALALLVAFSWRTSVASDKASDKEP